MLAKAWIQMGCERREVTWDISDDEIESAGADLESYIEDQVLDWLQGRYGWGWSCELITNDFSDMEESASPRLVVTDEILNPRTQRFLVSPRASDQLLGWRTAAG